MWRRPRLVAADTKSPAPQPGRNAWWRGAFAPDPATGTEAGPGPTTPRRSAVRRASRLRGRLMPPKRGVARYCATRIKAGRLWALRQSPRSGVGSDEGEKGRKKNPDAKRAGRKKTGLFDIVNRKRRGRRIGQRLERHRVSGKRARVPAERAPRRALLHEVPLRAREP